MSIEHMVVDALQCGLSTDDHIWITYSGYRRFYSFSGASDWQGYGNERAKLFVLRGNPLPLPLTRSQARPDRQALLPC